MLLATPLLLATTALLVTEVVIVIALIRLALEVDGNPGGHFARVLSRTMVLIVVAQFVEVCSDFFFVEAPETGAHFWVVGIELVALLIIFAALVWAWLDLTRPRHPR